VKRKPLFKKKKIKFLGFEVGINEISLQPHISQKITKYPDQLRTKKQIQGFLELLNCARFYILDLAKEKRFAKFTQKKQHSWLGR